MALLAATALTATPAWADGGAGSRFGINPGGAGGTDSANGVGGAGGSGSNFTGGGGGGAGVSGGNGGSTALNVGGLGATTPGGSGGNGTGADGASGGSGGGGGAHFQVLTTSGAVAAGVGGAGGAGGDNAAGGGGGAGGWGASITGGSSFTNAGSVSGGAGGNGGSGANGGSGGGGGVGVQFTGSGATFTNTGTVTGGAGGDGGAGGSSAGAGGVGGDAIAGSNLTIVNRGTITGGNAGMNGDTTVTSAGNTIIGSNLTVINSGTIAVGSGTGVRGIIFTGGTNVLELQAGSAITGAVVAVAGGNDVLRLGGSTAASFNMSTVGSILQYRNFDLFEKTGTSTWTLTGTPLQATSWTISQGTLAMADANSIRIGRLTFNGGTLQALGTLGLANPVTLNSGGGTIDTNGNSVVASGVISGTGGLTKSGTGTLTLTGANTYTGGTTVSGGTLEGTTTSLQGNIVNNATVTFNQTGSGTYAGVLSGTGSLTVQGGGTVTLSGTNSYTGGTSVLAGALIGNTSSLRGNILNNGAVTFNQTGSGTYAGTMSGSGSLIIQGGGSVTLSGTNSYTGGTSVLAGALIGSTSSLQGNILNNGAVTFNQTGSGPYAGDMSGTGSLTLQGGGTLTMTGANTYTGATTVNASMLVVNGSLASAVTLTNGGTLGGSGSIGGLVATGAIIAPGNSIGTLNVNGNFTQTGGTYVVEANAAGQSDRINVAGTATISSATVQVVAAPGAYSTSTTYTILNATGGVTGTYAGATSNFAFLTPTLSYNANNVFLTLALQGNAFSGFGGNTVNQRNVGSALDQTWANASGDFATVIGALANLNTQQAGPALDAISGQQYADFGTTNIAGASLFMNTLGQQMANARSGSGGRVALAQACEVEACDPARPLSAWFSGLGGLGSVHGNGNSSTLTYNVGGGAAGIDYQVMSNLLVGLGVGYAHGTQWVNSFMGQGWSDSVSIAAYGSFTQSNFYADVLAGYAYIGNQMQRQIQIPGLQQRTANGSTGANQFLAQLEAGYKVGVWAMTNLTPFARFQTSVTSQNAFTESGANSLNLSVAQQTTSSVRTVLGAQLDSTIGAFGFGLRLGWQHEYANVGRPITASFAGAPSASFTVYGATPTRDAAIIGFSATTAIAAATQLYLRYDGEVGSGTDNHALNLGLRVSW